MNRHLGILERIFASIIAGIVFIVVYLFLLRVFASLAEGYSKLRKRRLRQRRYMKFGRAQFIGESRPINREK
jgi:DNA invertase Pin-like site-specific DNA recombinase